MVGKGEWERSAEGQKRLRTLLYPWNSRSTFRQRKRSTRKKKEKKRKKERDTHLSRPTSWLLVVVIACSFFRFSLFSFLSFLVSLHRYALASSVEFAPHRTARATLPVSRLPFFPLIRTRKDEDEDEDEDACRCLYRPATIYFGRYGRIFENTLRKIFHSASLECASRNVPARPDSRF